MIEVTSIRYCDGGDGIKLTVAEDGVKNTYTVSADFYIEKNIKKIITPEG